MSSTIVNERCNLKTRTEGALAVDDNLSTTYDTLSYSLLDETHLTNSLFDYELRAGLTNNQFITHGRGGPVDEPLILHTHNLGSDSFSSDYYVQDGLGSITELVTSEGSFSAELIYNSFGEIKSSSGIALQQPYSYTGREFDSETNLYFYRFRYYNPMLGIFITRDQAFIHELIHGENLGNSKKDLAMRVGTNFLPYIYANNKPISSTDPYGALNPNGLPSALLFFAITASIVSTIIAIIASVISTILVFDRIQNIDFQISSLSRAITLTESKCTSCVAADMRTKRDKLRAERIKLATGGVGGFFKGVVAVLGGRLPWWTYPTTDF